MLNRHSDLSSPYVVPRNVVFGLALDPDSANVVLGNLCVHRRIRRKPRKYLRGVAGRNLVATREHYGYNLVPLYRLLVTTTNQTSTMHRILLLVAAVIGIVFASPAPTAGNCTAAGKVGQAYQALVTEGDGAPFCTSFLHITTTTSTTRTPVTYTKTVVRYVKTVTLGDPTKTITV